MHRSQLASRKHASHVCLRVHSEHGRAYGLALAAGEAGAEAALRRGDDMGVPATTEGEASGSWAKGAGSYGFWMMCPVNGSTPRATEHQSQLA